MKLQDLPVHLRKVAAMYGQYLIPIARLRKSVSVDKLYKVLDQVITAHVPERVLLPLKIQVQSRLYTLEEQILLCIFSYQENVLEEVPKDQMSPRMLKIYKRLRAMTHRTTERPSTKTIEPFTETLLTILSCIGSTIHAKKLLRSTSGMLRIDKEASILQIISHAALCTRSENNQEITVQEMLKVPTKDGIEELIQGPLVIFFADRYSKGGFNPAKITYTDTLTTFNGDRFFLGAVLECISEPDKYRTFIRHEDYFISTEGYKGPLPDSVSENGLLYVYQPLYESIDDYHLKYWSSKDMLCIFPFTDTITDIVRLYKKIFLTINVAKCYPTLRMFFKDHCSHKNKYGTLQILNLSDFISLTQHLNLTS